jgi:CubicO group peptidase (beta-lactamase class C family)
MSSSFREDFMRSFLHALCLFVAASLLIPGAAAAPFQAETASEQAQRASSKPAEVDHLLQSIATGEYPGAAIGVVRDGQPILLKGYGRADVEKGVPNTSATLFRIGSVTKSFTAIAILQLVERGQLSLDDPVSRYLPDFPRSDEIRIRNLLSHTAGVPDFVSYEQAKNMPLEFQPGTRINYSNTGYNMLGMILEKVTGRKYEEYLGENIFRPAGMTHSGYDRRRELPGRARGYLLDEKGVYQPIPAGDVTGAFAAGGLYSNVEDLVCFGFMTSEYRGLREVGHGGDINGFNAYVARYPEHHFAVVVLSNTGMRPPGPVPDAATIAHRVAEIYLGQSMAKPDAVADVKVATAVLDSYVGRYEIEAPDPVVNAMGRYLTILRDGDHLVADSKVGKAPLNASSETTFRATGSPVELTFVRDGQGKEPRMIISLMGLRQFPAHRIE